MNGTALIILGILFWVLFSMFVVTSLITCFVSFEYYRWNKQDRELEQVGEMIDAKINPGGGI